MRFRSSFLARLAATTVSYNFMTLQIKIVFKT